MQSVTDDFDSKVAEISLYFDFLKLLNKDNAAVSVPIRVNSSKLKTVPVSTDIRTILKANIFLLLYNLIESTVEKTILAIFEELKTKNTRYEHASDQVQITWRHARLRGVQHANPDTISNHVKEIIDDIVNGRPLEFDVMQVRKLYQGNLDADKIRKIGKTLGLTFTPHVSTQGGAKLILVKQRRNDLAHGTFSFMECGRDYTLDDLDAIKKQVVRFLKDLMTGAKKYLQKKAYLP